jgi:hypothetical protein
VFELIRGLEFEAIVSLDFIAEVDTNAIRETHVTSSCKSYIAVLLNDGSGSIDYNIII